MNKLFQNLSAPAQRALAFAGIDTVEKLSEYTCEQILKLQGIGKASITKLESLLKLENKNFKNKIMNSTQITVTATVNASATKTWDYYTNPAHIVNWNFADPSWHCPSAVNDLKVGGTYNARMEAKDGSFGFDFEAAYSEITIGKHFTYGFGGRNATVQFNDLGTRTEVIVSFDPETENSLELQKNGWQAILNNFKNYTENN